MTLCIQEYQGKIRQIGNYIKKSSLVGVNDEDIGNGLFAGKDYRKNEVVEIYVGEIISMYEYDKLIGKSKYKDRNKYGILLKGKEKDDDALVLDCYWHYKDGECLASAANDSRKCKFVSSTNKCEDNVRIVINYPKNGKNFVAKLVCIKDIKKDEEILVSYGKNYWRLKYLKQCL